LGGSATSSQADPSSLAFVRSWVRHDGWLRGALEFLNPPISIDLALEDQLFDR